MSETKETLSKIEVKSGVFFQNRTYTYLAPLLKAWGKEFTTRVNDGIFKLAYGVDDNHFLARNMLRKKYPIFIMVDRAYNPKKFNSFLEYIREHESYISDYSCEIKSNETSRKHMIVLTLPNEMKEKYEYFLEGKYSKMFSKNDTEIEKYYKPSSIAIRVFNREKDRIQKHIENISEIFNVSVSEENFENLTTMELDLPYSVEKEKEIF